MTTPDNGNLEQQLAQLTEWQGPAPQLWRKALNVAGNPSRGGKPWTLIRSRAFISAMAACIVFAAIGTSVWRLQSGQRPSPAAPAAHTWGLDYNGNTHFETDFKITDISPEGQAPLLNYVPSAVMSGEPAAGTTTRGTERKVVRKVTIQLTTSDVRAAYLRAGHLISQAKGEFVQDSALTGSGNALQANLTLRVAVDRLPEVLDQLRDLGKVESEQANGEDVTEQSVDLEARLNNERRVETELQKLLESRKDSPLKEILELRDKLQEIRGSIEKLTAQRNQLSRLVNLATVLVLIRPSDVVAPPAAPQSIAAYFNASVSAAWNHSIRFLADTVAMFVAILVGGLILWIAIIILIVIALRYHRRRDKRQS